MTQMYRVIIVPDIVEVDVYHLDVAEFDKLAADPMFQAMIPKEKQKLLRDNFIYAIKNGLFKLIEVDNGG